MAVFKGFGAAGLALAGSLLLAASGWAAPGDVERPPAPAGGRYVMNPVDGGVLRMDTDTGVVSLCARRNAAWSCETVPDDYKALQKDADKLTEENARLKRELAELRRDGGAPARADRKLELPSEEEIDKAIGQLEKYMKKFKGLIEKHTGGAEAPGRI